MINTGIVDQFHLHKSKPKLTKEQALKKRRQMQERDSELKTGIFKNMENPGGDVSFVYKKYPGEPITKYHLFDGQQYTLPRGVWKHLANDCATPVYEYIKNSALGNQIHTGHNVSGQLGGHMKVINYKYRFAFQSMEFMSDEIDIAPTPIVEVEYA